MLNPMGRPATGQTPVRAIRIPDAIWEPIVAEAEHEGITASELANRILGRHVTATARKAKRDT